MGSANSTPTATVGVIETHRVLAFLAPLSMLGGLATLWANTTAHSPLEGLIVTLGYAALLTLAAGAFLVRSPRAELWLDASVVGVAAIIETAQLPALKAMGYPSLIDEGRLTQLAIQALRHGVDPYGRSLIAGRDPHVTELMNGHLVTNFQYPPFAVILGVVGSHVWSGFASTAVLSTSGLIAAMVVMFVALPRQLRPLSVLLTFGIGFMTGRAQGGEPVAVAIPLLIGALWSLSSIGRTGRLTVRDVARGALLGLAMATQQLVWFLVPFIVVMLWCIRRADRKWALAAATLVPYVGTALLVFALVNAPFVLANAGAWWRGITAVFTQDATPYGPGFAMVSVYLRSGSGALGFYAYAALLLYLALLVLLASAPRLIGPGFLLLPMVVFMLSVRSEDTYYVCFAMVFGFVAATLRRDEVALARGIFEGRPVWARVRRTTMGVLAVGSATCLAIALFTPAPFTVHVGARRITQGGRLVRLEVRLTNTSSAALGPHFTVLDGAALLHQWRIVTGPRVLPSGTTSDYTVAPRRRFEQVDDSNLDLVVLTDRPETITTAEMPCSTHLVHHQRVCRPVSARRGATPARPLRAGRVRRQEASP